MVTHENSSSPLVRTIDFAVLAEFLDLTKQPDSSNSSWLTVQGEFGVESCLENLWVYFEI